MAISACGRPTPWLLLAAPDLNDRVVGRDGAGKGQVRPALGEGRVKFIGGDGRGCFNARRSGLRSGWLVHHFAAPGCYAVTVERA